HRKGAGRVPGVNCGGILAAGKVPGGTSAGKLCLDDRQRESLARPPLSGSRLEPRSPRPGLFLLELLNHTPGSGISHPRVSKKEPVDARSRSRPVFYRCCEDGRSFLDRICFRCCAARSRSPSSANARCLAANAERAAAASTLLTVLEIRVRIS